MELAYKAKSAWEDLNKNELAEMEKLSDGYLNFLNNGKTERECTIQIIKEAKAHGFKPLEEVIKSGFRKKRLKGLFKQ